MALLDASRPCPVCVRQIPVTDRWTLATHYTDGERCDGSQEPVQRPEPARRAHGSRRR